MAKINMMPVVGNDYPRTVYHPQYGERVLENETQWQNCGEGWDIIPVNERKAPKEPKEPK